MSSEAITDLEGLILYVDDLDVARKFYSEFLGLAVVFDDGIIVVFGNGGSRLILHRNDRGHDERGIWPAGDTPGAAALRFSVADPDAWEAKAIEHGIEVVWPAQDAPWGRVVVVADPQKRPIALAAMRL